MTANFFRAAPYADDAMNLPVRDIDTAIPFYESKMGFRVVSRLDKGYRKAVLERDTIQIGLPKTVVILHKKAVSLRSTMSRRLWLNFDRTTQVSKQIFKCKNMVTRPIGYSSSSHPTVCAIASAKHRANLLNPSRQH